MALTANSSEGLVTAVPAPGLPHLGRCLDRPFARVDNGPPLVRRISSFLALSATLAVVAACGSGASAEQKWADSVCTSVGTWKSQIQKSTDEIRQKVRSPGAGTLAAVQGDVQEAVDATQKLGTDLKALDAPNADSGAQAKQQLDSLADQLQTTASQAKQTVQGVPEGATLSQTIQQLPPLATALKSLGSSASSTLDSIQASSSKLKDGFQKADSCEQFR